MDAVKVLMVDDEARMRKLVKDFLAIKGYKVILSTFSYKKALPVRWQSRDPVPY